MKKKASKFLAMLVVLAMLVSTMALTVAADGPCDYFGTYDCEETEYCVPDGGSEPGSDWDYTLPGGNAGNITKVLRMPLGTVNPEATFVFDAVAVESPSGQPLAGNIYWTMNMPANLDTNPVLGSSNFPAGTTGTDIYVLHQIDLLFTRDQFPGPGRHVLRVTERPNTTGIGVDYDDLDEIRYNPRNTSFYVYVYVGADDTTGIIGVVVTEIRRAFNQAYCCVAPGCEYLGDDEYGCVCLSATTADALCCECRTHDKIDADGMIFENHLIVTPDVPTDLPTLPTDIPTDIPTDFPSDLPTGDFPSDAGSLIIRKSVTGNMGNPNHRFAMSIELFVPELLSDYVTTTTVTRLPECDCPAGEYECDYYEVTLASTPDNRFPEYILAFIVSANGNGLPFTIPVDQDTGEVSVSFYLRDGESLHFIQLPYGTTYSLTEYEVVVTDGNPGYEQSAAVIQGGVNRPGDFNDPVVGENLYVQDTAPELHVAQEAGEGSSNNRVNVLNHRTVPTPMGVFLNNLPFIGLIVLAVGGLVGFLVIKTRASKRYASAYQA